MAFLKHANNAVSSIATLGGINNSATSVSIQSGDTGLFPSSGNFEVTLWPAGTNATQANSEIVLVTAGQGTSTFTITRAQESTTAKNFNQGDNIALLITAKQLTDIESSLSGGSQGSVPYFNSSGVLVGLTPGTSGQVLETQGPGQNPIWATPSSASAWTSDLNTWTYASAQTFTISGNFTAIYTKGTKLQWTDSGGVKYGVVLSSSFSNPNTTVTIFTNSDYTIGNSTITFNSYSYQVNPPGFPGWFNFVPIWQGFSSNPVVGNADFSIQGNTCTIRVSCSGNGTSNQTYTNIANAPIASVGYTVAYAQVTDNGIQQHGIIFLNASNLITGAVGDVSGNFTASGSKGMNFTITYHI
jgi:hypothetical protein